MNFNDISYVTFVKQIIIDILLVHVINIYILPKFFHILIGHWTREY